MPSFVRARRRVKNISVAVNTDYSEAFPAGLFRSLFVKLSGLATGSGAGANALDGPFGLLGRIEIVRGNEPVIAMHGSDLRHLASMLNGGHAEILPASIAAGSNTYLGQVELPLFKLIPEAAIDARSEDLVVRGRFRALTNLGTTVTALGNGRLRVSGETTALPNGDHYEPRFVTQTVDISTSSSQLVSSKRIGNDVEICAGLFLRQFDASAELTDPNASRTDGIVREVKVELERGGEISEVGRWTWGEIKAMSSTRYGVSAATGQISTGVGLVTFDDPETPQVQENLILQRGDVLNVYVDTAGTIEDEFTAVTPAAGDLFYLTFLNFLPRGPGVNAQRIANARDSFNAGIQRRIAAARSNLQG